MAYGSGNMKRLAAPTVLKMPRRTTDRYIIKASPGPHPLNKSLPLAHVLRDIFGWAETMAEARQILNGRKVKVDGVVRTVPAFSIGLMDVLTVEDKSWRVVPSQKGFALHPVPENEATIKLLRVQNKNYVGGKLQLSLHDGRTMIVDKDIYKTGDVLVWDFASKQVKDVIQFKRGVNVILIEGQNRGKTARVEDTIIARSSQPNRVVLKMDNQTKETRRDYAFALGQERAVISIPESKGENK